jgi:hypothetical protein
LKEEKSDSLKQKKTLDSLHAISNKDSTHDDSKKLGGLRFRAGRQSNNGIFIDTSGLRSGSNSGKMEYPSVEAYDAIQAELPEDRKTGFSATGDAEVDLF